MHSLAKSLEKIFLFPSSRASRSCRAPREISRSPRLAHKAPVMQASFTHFSETENLVERSKVTLTFKSIFYESKNKFLFIHNVKYELNINVKNKSIRFIGVIGGSYWLLLFWWLI